MRRLFWTLVFFISVSVRVGEREKRGRGERVRESVGEYEKDGDL